MDPFKPLPGRRGENPEDLWKPLLPVPEGAPPPPLAHRTLGPIECSWEYRDAEGRLLFLVARFGVKVNGSPPKKETRPLTFCEHTDGRREWRWKSSPLPRPLYGLDRLASRPDASVLVAEGEKTADAAQQIFPDFVVVTSPGGSNAAAQADWSPLADRDVIVWPDADGAGARFASEVSQLTHAAGAASVRGVRLPEGLPQSWDLADPLPEGMAVERVRELLACAEPWESAPPAPEPETSAVEARYRDGLSGTYWEKPTRDGGSVSVRLANFTARIVAEETRDDGSGELAPFFHVAGRRSDGSPLRELSVAASAFPGLGWVSQWGAGAVVAAGFGQRDHLRAAIQTLSPEPERRHVFTHTGWREVPDGWRYLHGGGAIGAEGAVAGIRVNLTNALAPFVLPDPPEGEDLVAAVRASLGLLDVAPLRVSLPVHAAVLRSVLCSSQFTVWLLGPTGVLKTALAVLGQQHFGAGFNVENLPASCSSTGNSLEVLAFLAKDALLLVDDFAPSGTQQDVAKMHRELERIVRAQGNSSGRGRLRADGELRPVKPPRGLVLVTGEDLLRGESARARVVTVEVAPGDVGLAALGRAQADAEAGRYASALSAFLRWAAARLPELRTELMQSVRDFRERCASEGMHLRTPGALGELLAAEVIFQRFAVEAGAIRVEEAASRRADSERTLLELGRAQAAHVRAEDAVHRFFELLQGAVASGEAYVEDADQEGQPPGGAQGASLWGWRLTETRVAPQGRRIGWKRGDDLFLHPAASYHAAQRFAAGQGSSLPVSERTLGKRLAQGGFLKSRDSEHVAPKVRIHRSRVRCLHVSTHHVSETGAIGAAGAGSAPEAPSSAQHGAGGSHSGPGSQAGANETGTVNRGRVSPGHRGGPGLSPRSAEGSDLNRGQAEADERIEAQRSESDSAIGPTGPDGPASPDIGDRETRRWKSRLSELRLSEPDDLAASEQLTAEYILADPELDLLGNSEAEARALRELAFLGILNWPLIETPRTAPEDPTAVKGERTIAEDFGNARAR